MADSPQGAPAPRSRRRVSPATTTPYPYGATPARARQASLAKPPRVTRAACTAAPSTRGSSTCNCRRGSPCTSGTWSPTALSSAVTAFRCLDGYDRHKEPPTPFGGRAASSSQIEIHLNSSVISRAWRTRTVPTVSGDAILKALVQACRPRSIRRSPSWCTWSVVWRDRGRSASGFGPRAAGPRAGHPVCILVRARACGALSLHVQM